MPSYANPVARSAIAPALEPLAEAADVLADLARTKFADGDGHLCQVNYDDGLTVVVVEGTAAEMLRQFMDSIPPKEAL